MTVNWHTIDPKEREQDDENEKKKTLEVGPMLQDEVQGLSLQWLKTFALKYLQNMICFFMEGFERHALE